MNLVGSSTIADVDEERANILIDAIVAEVTISSWLGDTFVEAPSASHLSSAVQPAPHSRAASKREYGLGDHHSQCASRSGTRVHGLDHLSGWHSDVAVMSIVGLRQLHHIVHLISSVLRCYRLPMCPSASPCMPSTSGPP